MVLDHQAQELAIEGRILSRGQRGHLLGRGHAGHVVRHGHGVMRRRVGRFLAALGQPVLHKLDFIGLGRIDAPGDIHEFRTVGARGDQGGHLHRLIVVRNHILHKAHIVRRIAAPGNFRGFTGAEFAHALAGSARLNDGHLRACVKGQGQGAEGRTAGQDRVSHRGPLQR